jgi:nucleotide-binding universal stress UspA family protein
MRIVVGVDDSKFSEEAIQAIVRQFRPQDTEVQVLHVLQPVTVSPPPEMAAGYAPELEGLVGAARELVERMAQTLRARDFKVNTAIKEGDARLTIIDSAVEWKADLIVVGSHGRSVMQRLLLGSTADSVARTAHCSVEIVRIQNKN